MAASLTTLNVTLILPRISLTTTRRLETQETFQEFISILHHDLERHWPFFTYIYLRVFPRCNDTWVLVFYKGGKYTSVRQGKIIRVYVMFPQFICM